MSRNVEFKRLACGPMHKKLACEQPLIGLFVSFRTVSYSQAERLGLGIGVKLKPDCRRACDHTSHLHVFTRSRPGAAPISHYVTPLGSRSSLAS